MTQRKDPLRGQGHFFLCPRQRKHPAHRGRHVFLLASGNLDGPKFSKAREYQELWERLENYRRCTYLQEEEACGSSRGLCARQEQLESKEAEDRGRRFDSHLPSFLNSTLPHVGSKSLCSRAWKPCSSVAYPKCPSHFSCGADQALIFQVSPPPSHGSQGNSGLSEGRRSPSFDNDLFKDRLPAKGMYGVVCQAGELGKVSS